MADMEIKSCEPAENAACESHADSSVVLAPCSVTGDKNIQSLFYRHLRPFKYHFSGLNYGHLILNLCCIHFSDSKVSTFVTEYIYIYI